jgi:hypothetical protein
MLQETLNDINVQRVARVKCLKSLLFHTRYFFYTQNKRKFIVSDHHQIIVNALEDVLTGKCKRLGISIAPRYTKTELAVKSFISHGLSLNPAAKFIHLSYGDDIALDNSEYIKDLIESAEYQALFPGTHIKWDSSSKKKWYTNHGGGLLARAAAGQVTGFGAGQMDDEDEFTNDINDFLIDNEDLIGHSDPLEDKFEFNGAIIIDDPIKPEDADQDTIREKVNSRFDSTIRNRVNSRNTPIIVIMQRLHPNDLIGYLQRKEEADEWRFITLPCLIEDNDNGIEAEIDGTKKKWRALWPHKHTVEELLKLQRSNELVFGRQYMQDPSPKSGLLFPIQQLNFYNPAEVDLTDPDFLLVAADPADLGGDNFAGGACPLVENRIYIEDIIFNTDGADVNEVAMGEMILSRRTAEAIIEGTLGWKETANRIRGEIVAKGYKNEFRIVRPRIKKHVRILNRASFIRNNFYFRSDWQDRPQYAKFMRNVITYLKIQEAGKANKHDDGPDLCEMIAAYFEKTMPHLW